MVCTEMGTAMKSKYTWNLPSTSDWDTGIGRELIAQLSDDLAKSIDFSIIAQMLVDSGWLSVVTPHQVNHRTPGMAEWMEENCQGKYQYHDQTFLFEDARDISMFTLRWL
jgi:hypothetical protein